MGAGQPSEPRIDLAEGEEEVGCRGLHVVGAGRLRPVAEIQVAGAPRPGLRLQEHALGLIARESGELGVEAGGEIGGQGHGRFPTVETVLTEKTVKSTGKFVVGLFRPVWRGDPVILQHFLWNLGNPRAADTRKI